MTLFGQVVVETKETGSRAAKDAKTLGLGEWMWKERLQEVQDDKCLLQQDKLGRQGLDILFVVYKKAYS